MYFFILKKQCNFWENISNLPCPKKGPSVGCTPSNTYSAETCTLGSSILASDGKLASVTYKYLYLNIINYINLCIKNKKRKYIHKFYPIVAQTAQQNTMKFAGIVNHVPRMVSIYKV